MTRPRVLVTRKLPGAALDRLAELTDMRLLPSTADFTSELANAEGILCTLVDRIDAALLERAPKLRALSSCSVGLDHVDLDACTARGIAVGYTPGVLVDTTAELAFALLLASARRVVEADRFLRAGQWTEARRWEPDMLLGRDLSGASLGIVGLGAIGQAVAVRARAFGMHVLGFNRTPRAVEGVQPVSLDELLARSDFVSLHVALSADTRGLFDRRRFAAMKPGAILINTARGALVDEAALVEALERKQLAGAGLDVFAEEPLARESPLLAFDNVVLLPHIGSASLATRARMTELSVENLLAGLAGRPMPRCANPAAYGAR